MLYLTTYTHVSAEWVGQQLTTDLDIAQDVMFEILEQRYKRDPNAGLDPNL